MAIQDLMNEEEYKTYIINLSAFARKYSLLIPDLNLIDLTLENFPSIENKVEKLKNKIGITIESVLDDNEIKTFLTYLGKVLKSYKKKFNLIASRVLYEKNAISIFYADFTLKKDYARKLLNLDRKGYDKIAKLDNAYFINIETISNILNINQEDFQYLIDRSITYWNENFKDK